jgi:hypothetical protein
MNHEQYLEESIRQFTNWDRPWTFCDTVRMQLTDEVQSLFDSIWKEALATQNWQHPDLKRCTEIVEKNLSKRFPNLSGDTLKAIANAAAYQLR